MANYSERLGASREESHRLLRGLRPANYSTASNVSILQEDTTFQSSNCGPRLVINLAREIRAPELLPSAFYDLSRCQPSQAALGIRHSSEPDVLHRLSDTDLLDVLRGRETASRFLSTFIVDELEGREASEWCLHRNSASLARQRACGIAFEAITFELLRDVNGVVVNRNSDPLYTIADAELMQTRNESHALGNNKLLYLACEACLAEFSAVVEAARGEFWDKLPEMFGVKDLERWG